MPLLFCYQARLAINELELAKKDFEHVLRIDAKNKETQQQLNLVNKKIKQHTAKEKSIYGELTHGFVVFCCACCCCLFLNYSE